MGEVGRKSEALVIAAGAVVVGAGVGLGVLHAPHGLAEGARWLGVALLMVSEWRRRSLTLWIFVAMMAGAELGFDAPHVAVQLRVLSDIFLRLIRTIVAPLILATLIVGIAGHGDLKSVGRMGLKALVYFEVVTTLALAVGLVAINLSKAGVGLTVSAASGAAPVVTAPVATRWDEVLLHVFPENLAKSIAEGQVLQVVVFAVLFGIALATVSEAKRAPVLRLCESLSEVMFRLRMW
jgi:proton glutamate symport protein